MTTGAEKIANISVDLGETLWQDGSHAFDSARDGLFDIGGEFVNTFEGIGRGFGHFGKSVGNGLFNLADDGLSTAGNVGGALLDGDVGQAGEHLIDGAGKAKDHAVEAAAGAVEGLVEAGGAVVSGELEMAGTAAGVAGELGKDYLHAGGKILTSGVDVVGTIAEGEVAVYFGAGEIAADTVGGPAGEFYGNVIHNYGEAATTTLGGAREAINGGVNAGTNWGGEYVDVLGQKWRHTRTRCRPGGRRYLPWRFRCRGGAPG